MLRQVAYQQHLPLPGPDADPQGWLTMRPTLTSGMLFKARRVDVRCTVSMNNYCSPQTTHLLPSRCPSQNLCATLEALFSLVDWYWRAVTHRH